MSTSFEVIVTRPSPYGEQLCDELEQQGFRAVHCPLIRFEADTSVMPDDRLDYFAQSQTWIFVSRQAVHYAFNNLTIDQQQKVKALSQDKTIIAVGAATADSLRQYQLESLVPQTPNSEGMIQLLDQHNLRQQPALLIRGNKGRPLLQEYFTGHQLSIMPVYRRQMTQQTLAQTSDAAAIVVTSGQLMELVAKQINTSQQRQQSTIISGSARISQIAQQFGFTNCYTANDASNSELVRSCILWRNNVS